MTDLPEGWTVHLSRTKNKPYYYHAATQTNTWVRPTNESARKRHKPNPAPSPTPAPAPVPAPAPDPIIDPNAAPSVAIIVPFRDLHSAQKRASHLRAFIPHMTKFLMGDTQPPWKKKENNEKEEKPTFHIYIVEQSNDQRKFNRGKLLNIGYHFALQQSDRHHDIFIFHDVDLLPSVDLYDSYTTRPEPNRPVHIARVWDRYSNNPKYMGGVVAFNRKDYEVLNGYPNNYWGWGGEDDELQRRLAQHTDMQFVAPTTGSLQDLEDMNLQEKLSFLKENKEWKCMVKWELEAEHSRTWRSNGLSDLQYTEMSVRKLNKYATKLTVDVLLNGDDWTNAKAGADHMEG